MNAPPPPAAVLPLSEPSADFLRTAYVRRRRQGFTIVDSEALAWRDWEDNLAGLEGTEPSP